MLTFVFKKGKKKNLWNYKEVRFTYKLTRYVLVECFSQDRKYDKQHLVRATHA